MAFADRTFLAGMTKRIRGEVADRAEESKGRLVRDAVRNDQAPIDEPFERREGIVARLRRDALDGRKIEWPGKDTEAGKESLFEGLELLVTPPDRRVQRSLAIGQIGWSRRRAPGAAVRGGPGSLSG